MVLSTPNSVKASTGTGATSQTSSSISSSHHPVNFHHGNAPNRLANPPAFIEYQELRFLVMDAPSDGTLPLYIKVCDVWRLTFLHQEFMNCNVTSVVRVCDPTYNKHTLTEANIAVHVYFESIKNQTYSRIGRLEMENRHRHLLLINGWIWLNPHLSISRHRHVLQCIVLLDWDGSSGGGKSSSSLELRCWWRLRWLNVACLLWTAWRISANVGVVQSTTPNSNTWKHTSGVRSKSARSVD